MNIRLPKILIRETLSMALDNVSSALAALNRLVDAGHTVLLIEHLDTRLGFTFKGIRHVEGDDFACSTRVSHAVCRSCSSAFSSPAADAPQERSRPALAAPDPRARAASRASH